MSIDYTAAVAMAEQEALNRSRGQLAKRSSILTLWTDDEIDLVTSMWMAGKSAGVIAKALTTDEVQRTRNSVIGKVNRLGLMRKQGPQHVTLMQRSPAKPKRDPLKSRQKRTPSPLVAKPAPTPEPLPVVPPPKPPRPVGRLLLWDAPANACRWPMWGLGANEPRIVCSEPVLGAHVYCEAHCLRAYELPKPVLAKQIYRTTGANR